jgi:hypothetical protein
MLASGAGSALSASGQLSVGDGTTGGSACNLDATSGVPARYCSGLRRQRFTWIPPAPSKLATPAGPRPAR